MRAPFALSLVAATVVAGGGYFYWSQDQVATRAMVGLATANGRVEVERVDISAKLPGRVAEIRVREGDFVDKDAVIARLDTAELNAQLARRGTAPPCRARYRTRAAGCAG
jgi:HlyD family secretion protein